MSLCIRYEKHVGPQAVQELTAGSDLLSGSFSPGRLMQAWLLSGSADSTVLFMSCRVQINDCRIPNPDPLELPELRLACSGKVHVKPLPGLGNAFHHLMDCLYKPKRSQVPVYINHLRHSQLLPLRPSCVWKAGSDLCPSGRLVYRRLIHTLQEGVKVYW